ncbi:hypothetical protein PG991_013376 [Apiospora marii]|uniref:Uncharacterized protein n=1 Tax=Apiospora marii TaxID=335849 RepID=A0ABR1R7P3_9PEZI
MGSTTTVPLVEKVGAVAAQALGDVEVNIIHAHLAPLQEPQPREGDENVSDVRGAAADPLEELLHFPGEDELVDLEAVPAVENGAGFSVHRLARAKKTDGEPAVR